jgi:hypothetical protein
LKLLNDLCRWCYLSRLLIELLITSIDGSIYRLCTIYHVCRSHCLARLSMVLSVTSVDRAAYQLCRWCYLARLSMGLSITSVDGAIDHLCQWCHMSRLSIALTITLCRWCYLSRLSIECRYSCLSALSMVLSSTSVNGAVYHLCRWCYRSPLSMVPYVTSVDRTDYHPLSMVLSIAFVNRVAYHAYDARPEAVHLVHGMTYRLGHRCDPPTWSLATFCCPQIGDSLMTT